MTFLLDTNVYIDAFNDPDLGAGLQRFHRDRLGRILLSQVVAFELLVGARGAKEVAGVRKALVEPFTRRRRLHVPAASTWELAAEIERRLRREGGFAASLARRSFGHDLLLAASARELGATLITSNRRDFEVLARVIDLKLAAPWPK